MAGDEARPEKEPTTNPDHDPRSYLTVGRRWLVCVPLSPRLKEGTIHVDRGGTSARDRGREPYDIAIIGAGPVGLTVALRLAPLATVAVIDRRSPPRDGDRPQLLVARPGDLARLAALGIDIDDPRLVAPIERRRGLAAGAGLEKTVEVDPDHRAGPLPRSLEDLRYQSPVALVPIARLQAALAERAAATGAVIYHQLEVTRLRRHAGAASIELADRPPLQARLVVIATGAAASLVEARARLCAREAMIAGVYQTCADRGGWTRVELPVQAGLGRVRCTLLETPTESGAGTALLVDAPDLREPSAAQLRRCFTVAARHHGLDGAVAVKPQVFETGVRYLDAVATAGDNRAPILVAGDAARSGHVFTGLTGFVNVALADDLAADLAPAIDAVREGRWSDPKLAAGLERCEHASALGASVLAEASRAHLGRGDRGWALAGV